MLFQGTNLIFIMQEGHQNLESLASIQQQTQHKAVELSQERRNFSKTGKYWITFLVIALLAWLALFISKG